uniref:Uncharacterized protein n=1 Tax=Arundo donax TaxID=35708 RepID=A0A0A9BZF7_ARUDO
MKPISWIKQYFHPCMGEESLAILRKQYMIWIFLPFSWGIKQTYWHTKNMLMLHSGTCSIL